MTHKEKPLYLKLKPHPSGMAFYINSCTNTFCFLCKFVKNLYKALDFTPLLLSTFC